MADGLTVGYVPGAWDMFHAGHLNILRLARASCDYLVVGVVTDEVLAAGKGRRPMYPLAERMQVVSALRLVDEVVLDTSSDKTVAWNSLHFDVLFKGDDWRATPKGDRLEAQMAAVGARVHYFPYTQHVSSTSLRKQAESEGRGVPTPPGAPETPAGRKVRRRRKVVAPDAANGHPAEGASATERPFRVLIVCEANRCRSPMGEYLLRRSAAAAGLRWEVASAGTQAVDGDPIDPDAGAVLSRQDIDTSRFRTRRLTPELCEYADLILVATDHIRDQVAALAPAASARVFTLLPFAHLMAGLPSEVAAAAVKNGQELLSRARTARSAVSPLRGPRDLTDPVGQKPERFQVCADTLDKAFRAIIGTDRET